MPGFEPSLDDSLRSLQRQLQALDAQVTLLKNTVPKDGAHLEILARHARMLDSALRPVTEQWVPNWAQYSLPPTLD